MAAEATSDSVASLEQARQQILQQVATLGDFRPGHLHERCIKCRKPGCRCRRRDHPGHGSYFLLQVRRGDNKRTTRSVPPRALETTRAQVAACAAWSLSSSRSASDCSTPRGASPGQRGAKIRKRKPPRSCSARRLKPRSTASYRWGRSTRWTRRLLRRTCGGVHCNSPPKNFRDGPRCADPGACVQSLPSVRATILLVRRGAGLGRHQPITGRDAHGQLRPRPAGRAGQGASETPTMCLGVGRTRVPLRTAETAERRGFPDAGPQVVLSDGAKWIWRLAGVQFPRAVSIVDLYHAKEKLWEVARALGLGRGPLPGSRRGTPRWSHGHLASPRRGLPTSGPVLDLYRNESRAHALQAVPGSRTGGLRCRGGRLQEPCCI